MAFNLKLCVESKLNKIISRQLVDYMENYNITTLIYKVIMAHLIFIKIPKLITDFNAHNSTSLVVNILHTVCWYT